MSDIKFDLVVPILKKDFEAFKTAIKWYRKYIMFDNIVIIANDELADELQETDFNFINENDLIKFAEVKRLIAEVTDNDEQSIKRTGWYYQQFLKIYYAKICKNDYYLIWDSDTMPLHNVDLFENKHPVFHVKTEHNTDYFNTFHNLFPTLNNDFGRSFISEHMIFSKKIMLEIIERLNVNGQEFYETIIKSIDRERIKYSGFSEYETYGLYTTQMYPELYIVRDWTSLREGARYFDKQHFGQNEVNWIKNQYDAISFEKFSSPVYGRNLFFHSKFLQKLFSFNTVLKINGYFQIIPLIICRKKKNED